MIKRLIARVHRIRLEFQESGSWYLLHDNTPVHSSGNVSEFLAKWGIPMLSHPFYSQFNAGWLFYFLNKKLRWKGQDSKLFNQSNRLWWENWRPYGKKCFLGHSIRCISDANIVRKQMGTILSDGINKYFLTFLCGFFMASVLELNCYTV